LASLLKGFLSGPLLIGFACGTGCALVDPDELREKASQLDVVIPAAAIAVAGSIGTATNIVGKIAIANSSDGLGAVTLHCPASGTNTLNGFAGNAVPFHIMLGTSRTLWVKNFTIGVIRMAVSRFDLP
jgi:hypothetical protein